MIYSSGKPRIHNDKGMAEPFAEPGTGPAAAPSFTPQMLKNHKSLLTGMKNFHGEFLYPHARKRNVSK